MCTEYVRDPPPCLPRDGCGSCCPRLREGLPSVVLEAAAAGLAVITTLSTGMRAALIPEVTGLLVPPGYPRAIEEPVLGLLQDEKLRTCMGKAGREWVADRLAEATYLRPTRIPTGDWLLWIRGVPASSGRQQPPRHLTLALWMSLRSNRNRLDLRRCRQRPQRVSARLSSLEGSVGNNAKGQRDDDCEH